MTMSSRTGSVMLIVSASPDSPSIRGICSPFSSRFSSSSFFAALLNRVLVIPSSKVDYQFNHVLDIDHINKCLGRKVVVTFEEFAEAKKKHLHIDKFVCYFSLPQLCFMDGEHVKKLKSLGISMNKLEPAWVEDVKKPTKRTMQDVMTKFSSNDDVIAIGDVFFADVEQDLVMQPGGPLAHKCKTLIEPSRLIMLTAQRFIQTFLGERFIALHFRRHGFYGFLKFCNAKKSSCFFPIPQAADCIVRVAERANAPVIYLFTDAAESETSLLQSLVLSNGKAVPLVKRPARNSAEKWDALLYRHGLEEDSQVEAMLDKTICAMSSVFIGSSGSTFTEDILRLRKDWGLASLCDEYVCQGELPNFIADNE
ncbi:GDP-fucose protein like [Actinidia chinensis var. chinensis]|uniref:O-fucosyltransferase family protein n=1 Tax=Actinidia chinensis var. chinensis TaxID=1590841 RepID=A0A2R6R0J7_ACTCC|nr:GDP-fucose protein like [Actinidia chinensis var. chinensis]